MYLKKRFWFWNFNENQGKQLNNGLSYWKESFGASTIVQFLYEVETVFYCREYNNMIHFLDLKKWVLANPFKKNWKLFWSGWYIRKWSQEFESSFAESIADNSVLGRKWFDALVLILKHTMEENKRERIIVPANTYR
jgi:hypothetical protein